MESQKDLLRFDYGGAGKRLLENIRKGFWNEDGYFAKEKLIGTAKAFLWPYGGYTEAVASHYMLFGGDEAEKIYRDTLQGIIPYQACRDDGLLAYAAAHGGSGDIYYDDNVWLAIIFHNAFYTLGEEKWLELSERITEFCYSGWDDKLGGGVYWQENNKTSKNTCINAPLAKISAQLYKATGKQEYLDWARKLYSWTKETLIDKSDYIYNDNINLEGKINTWKFAYNTGCMIGAAAHLYQITKDEAYLEDAKRSADSALNGGFGSWDDGTYRLKDKNPWFNSWLLDGYMALYEVYPKDEYIFSFASAASYAAENAINNSGFVDKDWVSNEYPDEKVHLLDQSGTARILFDIQLWMNKHHK